MSSDDNINSVSTAYGASDRPSLWAPSMWSMVRILSLPDATFWSTRGKDLVVGVVRVEGQLEERHH